MTTPSAARLRPGAGTAIIGPGLALLLDAPHEHEVTQLLAAPALAGSDLLGLVSRLGGIDLATLPSFGCASVEDGGCRLLLRGSVVATVTDAAGRVERHDAADRSTWSELRVDDAQRIEMALPGAIADRTFELISGLAGAGALTVTVDAGRDRFEDADRLVAPSAPEPAAGAPGGTTSMPGVAAPTADTVSTEPEPAGALPAGVDTKGPPPASPDDGPYLDYQHLFEGTVYRATPGPTSDGPTPRAPDATSPLTAVFGDPDEPDLPIAADGPAPPAPPTPPTSSAIVAAAAAAADAPPRPGPGGLIDWVPGSSPPPALATTPPVLPPAPPAPMATAHVPVPVDDPLDDATVTQASLRAARSATARGPVVPAVRCPSGHPNPVHAETCRSCGTPIGDRSIHQVTRPSLGHLRFEDGATVELDRHVVLGRNPSQDLLVDGEPTQAVTIPSSDNALSRTHAVVQLDGWQVKVVDRDSMNHTFVEVPGRPPFQLRPSEPYPVPAGSTIRLGDEVAFTYETTVP